MKTILTVIGVVLIGLSATWEVRAGLLFLTVALIWDFEIPPPKEFLK